MNEKEIEKFVRDNKEEFIKAAAQTVGLFAFALALREKLKEVK